MWTAPTRVILLLPLLLGFLGCSQPPSGTADSPEAMAEEMLDCLNDTADLLEGIKDKTSAEAAGPKIDKLNERWARLRKKFDQPPELSDEKKMELSAKYPPRTQAALERLIRAYEKILTIPGAKEALSELNVGDFGPTR